jgi:YVTN family beta-propeller protein
MRAFLIALSRIEIAVSSLETDTVMTSRFRYLATASALCLLTLIGAAQARAAPDEEKSELPTGQFVTPRAAPGADFTELNPHLTDFPKYTVGQAISEALSPDGHTLVILTSGFNILYNAAGKQSRPDSNEYVFVYDVSASRARQTQVIEVPNTFAGITFAPDGRQLYVSGGGDDAVHVYALKGSRWVEAHQPIKLGHKAGNGIGIAPAVAGLAVTADGREVVAANYFNDSISLIDAVHHTVRSELDLRPGKSGGPHGVAGGENPFWVSVKGSSTAYIGSQRDREVEVVDISRPAQPRIVKRIRLRGNPVKMLLDARQAHLYVACDNSDAVVVIDTAANRVTGRIRTLAPPGMVPRHYEYRGVAPNSLALSADGRRLYVTNGGMNAVAVIALDREKPAVIGLIPTGWYPQAVAAGRLQQRLYVVNSRSNPGPNPANVNHRGHPVQSFAGNEYVLQLEKAGFLTFPLPSDDELATLTQQVLANDNFNVAAAPHDLEVMAALRARIKHVIYIIKENRTYDQILGDLGEGNGDPAITEFGAKITPNFHALARGFVDLDNFYVSGEVSSEGWPWSTAARESDQGVKTVPPAYASRGVTADTTGLNRGVNVAYATLAQRRKANPGTPDDPDLLPGTGDVAGIDGPGGLVQQGYIWSAALRAGRSVRNYGMEGDTTRYDPHDPHRIPLDLHPYADHLRVMYPAFPDLLRISDPYYRSFQPAYPDFFREKEWQREFAGYIEHGNLPQLSLIWLPGDHMGDFGYALDGVNTPELQQADNDYAVGLLVQAVARSPYRGNTLIFIVEDDAQDGPDHVDAHRSTAYVVGPYVRQRAVVSDYFTTVNLLRTLEDLLGIGHLSIFDANERPMTDLFDMSRKDWSFTAVPSCLLAGTTLPLGTARQGCAQALHSTHTATYWAAETKGMDFSSEDKVDAVGFNRIVWRGLMDRPYPTERSGAKLSLPGQGTRRPP